MISVAVDARFAGIPLGLARDSPEPTQAFRDLDNPRMRFVHLERSVGNLQGAPQCQRVAIADFGHYTISEQVHLPRSLRERGADVLYSPHLNLPMWCLVPLVASMHDLIQHRHPGDAFSLKRATNHLVMRRAVRSATSVLAVSDWTRADPQKHDDYSVAAKTVVTRECGTDQARAAALVTRPLEEGATACLRRGSGLRHPDHRPEHVRHPRHAQGPAMLIEPDLLSAVCALQDPPRRRAPVRVGSWSSAAATTAEVPRRATR